MNNVSIIVCEDEGIVAKDIQNRLKKMGYNVPAVVSSGEEAIRKVAEISPDLVLMDIRIKGEMDGVEAAQQIQDNFAIPIIYLTGNADQTTVERAKTTRPFGYILKPFKEKELQVNIEIAIDKYRLEKELKEREEWLATLLKSMSDAAIATDINNNIAFMNPVAEILTGWDQEEALSRDAAEIFTLANEQNRTIIENPFKKAFQESVVVNIPDQTILIARNAAEIPIHGCTAPVKDSKGNIKGAVMVFREINR